MVVFLFLRWEDGEKEEPFCKINENFQICHVAEAIVVTFFVFIADKSF